MTDNEFIGLMDRLHTLFWGKGDITAVSEVYKTEPPLSEETIEELIPDVLPYDDERRVLRSSKTKPVQILDLRKEWDQIVGKCRRLQNAEKFIVRQEYVDLLNHMDKTRRRKPGSEFRGWHICANSGIGKSNFCWFLLVTYLCRRQPVIWQFEANFDLGTYYIFDAKGCREATPADLPSSSKGGAITSS